jgi:hypothetical protein
MVYARVAAPSCSKCESLWKECFDALSEFLRILAERDAARARQDHDLVEAFEEIQNESLERCESARQAVSNHEVTHFWESARDDYGAQATHRIAAPELLLR